MPDSSAPVSVRASRIGFGASTAIWLGGSWRAGKRWNKSNPCPPRSPDACRRLGRSTSPSIYPIHVVVCPVSAGLGVILSAVCCVVPELVLATTSISLLLNCGLWVLSCIPPLRHASNPCGPISLCASANCCVPGPP